VLLSGDPCITLNFTLSTNQKHYQDLGRDTSSVWNFCVHYSDVILRELKWQPCETLAVFSGYSSLSARNPDKTGLLVFDVLLTFVICIKPFILYRDRIRTAVNVIGDAFGAGIVEHLSRNDLMSMDFTAREDSVPLEPLERYTPKNEEMNEVRASDGSLGATNF